MRRMILEYDMWIARVREDNPDFNEAYQELSRFEVTEDEVKEDDDNA